MKKQTLKAAIPGYGATGHLATTLLAQEAKIKIDQIPYRGAAPAMTDLLGGHVDLFFATPQSIVPQVHGRQMKAYRHHLEGAARRSLPNVESLVKRSGRSSKSSTGRLCSRRAGTPEAGDQQAQRRDLQDDVPIRRCQEVGGRRRRRLPEGSATSRPAARS